MAKSAGVSVDRPESRQHVVSVENMGAYDCQDWTEWGRRNQPDYDRPRP